MCFTNTGHPELLIEIRINSENCSKLPWLAPAIEEVGAAQHADVSCACCAVCVHDMSTLHGFQVFCMHVTMGYQGGPVPSLKISGGKPPESPRYPLPECNTSLPKTHFFLIDVANFTHTSFCQSHPHLFYRLYFFGSKKYEAFYRLCWIMTSGKKFNFPSNLHVCSCISYKAF